MAHKKSCKSEADEKIPRYIFLAKHLWKFSLYRCCSGGFMQQVISEIKNELFYGQMKQLKFHLKLIILKCV